MENSMQKRVIHKGVIGTVLTEGRACYMVWFPYGIKFVNKSDAKETHAVPDSVRKRKTQLSIVR